MSNSKLVSYTGLSPNHSGKRTHAIDRITPHAVVVQLSIERICDCFKDRSRQASCNYAIGADGRPVFALTSRTAHGVHRTGIMTSVPSPSNVPRI